MGDITQKERLIAIATPFGDDYFLLRKMEIHEKLSELYTVDIQMLHEEPTENFKPTMVEPGSILGKSVTANILQPDGSSRYFNGIINNFSQGTRNPRYSIYYATIVPHAWILTQNVQSRIFQQKSVPEILQEVFDGFEVSFELQGEFKKRNYCVQYRESDFDFASRLMEEEGIFYFFENTVDKDRLVIANTAQSHRDCPHKSEIPFFMEKQEGDVFVSAIREWSTDYTFRSNKITCWDYNFQLPTQKLDYEKNSRFNGNGAGEMEIYDFVGGYARKYDGIDKGGGEQPAELQNIYSDRQATVNHLVEALDSHFSPSAGTSDCSTLTAGHKFKMIEHPNKESNRYYVLTSVDSNYEQRPDYPDMDETQGLAENKFTCIPHGQGAPVFRPMRKTPKPVVTGVQTATVVGPAGEEIFTDKYGRIKVQFHWDRRLTFDPDSSCWVRVARDIAGKKWGTMYLPRIGQEVIVDFLYGDPDQPIVVGSVYNPETMPHYELPKYKTLTYIKTRTSPDDGKGYNELRFEDKAGKEQVFIRSQKRYDLRVRGSMYETCGGSRQEVIGLKQENQPGGNLAITVAGNYDLHVKEAHFIGIDQKLNEGIKGDVVEAYDSNQQTVVKGKVEINAREITLEAMNSVTLKVGSSFVKVDLVGVTIEGPMVKLNSGGAATPTSPAIIDDPLDAEVSDNGQPGNLENRRSGGGPSRRRRTLNGQHAPNITHEAFNLTRTAGHGDDMDRALVAAELSKLPPHVIQRMSDNGTKVVVGRGSITDIDPSLAGQQPRGWPPGSTWDSVPGLFDPTTNEVRIATRGHGTPEGPHVPATGDGHGSANLVIHESIHSVDHNGPGGTNISSTDPNFVNARNNDPAMMADGYEGTANAAGAEEGYAESAARYYSGDPNDAANHPGPHNYWASDPLNPNPPAPAGP